MIQELFHIGPLSISPFGAMMVIAFLVAWAQLRWGFRRLGIGDEEDASAVLLAAGIGGIVGAKIYYAALYGDWRLLFDRSGLVWYGGFVGGVTACFLLSRRYHHPFGELSDAFAPALSAAYLFGRFGCLFSGDGDYGPPSDLPWAMAFPNGIVPTDVSVHPTPHGRSVG